MIEVLRVGVGAGVGAFVQRARIVWLTVWQCQSAVGICGHFSGPGTRVAEHLENFHEVRLTVVSQWVSSQWETARVH